MLRKFVIAVSAVTLIGAVHAQAGQNHFDDSKGNQGQNQFDNKNDNKNKNDKNDKNDKGGDNNFGQFFNNDKGPDKSNVWKDNFKSKGHQDNTPDFGKDYGRDNKFIKDLEHCGQPSHDFFTWGNSPKGCDSHDACDKDYGCDDHKHCDDHGCDDHPCAVPLPAAAAQGLVGLGLLGVLGLGAAARRRILNHA